MSQADRERQAALKEGLSAHTLDRAALAVGVVHRKLGVCKPWTWELPAEPAAQTEEATTQTKANGKPKALTPWQVASRARKQAWQQQAEGGAG
jgi:hypothetical protein